jgi:hypothetical protein
VQTRPSQTPPRREPVCPSHAAADAGLEALQCAGDDQQSEAGKHRSGWWAAGECPSEEEEEDSYSHVSSAKAEAIAQAENLIDKSPA